MSTHPIITAPSAAPALRQIAERANRALTGKRAFRPGADVFLEDARRGRAISEPVLDALPALDVVDEGTERAEFGLRPVPPSVTGYRLRRVRGDITATLWNYRQPSTAAQALREIDGVLALRHGQNDEATLAGILHALALSGLCGEDVPAGEVAR